MDLAGNVVTQRHHEFLAKAKRSYEEVVTQRSHGICLLCEKLRGHADLTGNVVIQELYGFLVEETQRQHGFYFRYEEVVTQRSHGICLLCGKLRGHMDPTGNVVTQRYHKFLAEETQRQHGSYWSQGVPYLAYLRVQYTHKRLSSSKKIYSPMVAISAQIWLQWPVAGPNKC